MLLLIIIVVIIIYAIGSDNKSKEENKIVEGFSDIHKYYIGDKDSGDKGSGEEVGGDETLYNEHNDKIFEINQKDQLVNYRNRRKKINIEEVNSAPDPYHYMFEYNGDKIKIFLKNGEAKIRFDDESKEMDVTDNNDKTATNFNFRDKIICKAVLSDNEKYKYMFIINDTNMINLLPLFFVTFTLLQRDDAENEEDQKSLVKEDL